MALKLKTKPRPTTDEVFLPSGGYPYGEKLPDGRIIVQAFSWKTEQLLFQGTKSHKGKKQYARFLEAVRQVAKLPQNFDPHQFLAADMLYILLKARSLSYGERYTFTSTCPKCNHNEEVAVAIPEGMPHNRYPYDFKKDPYVDFTTSAGNETRIAFLTIQEEIDCETTIRSKVSAKHIPAENFDSELARYQLAAQIRYVNGEKVSTVEDVMAWFNDSLEEKEEAATFIGSVAPGVSYTIPMECENCGHNYDAFMPLGVEFFRPRRRVDTNKLPTGVRIGVFGEDIRSEVTPGSGEGDVSGDSESVRGGEGEGTQQPNDRSEKQGEKQGKKEKVEK